MWYLITFYANNWGVQKIAMIKNKVQVHELQARSNVHTWYFFRIRSQHKPSVQADSVLQIYTPKASSLYNYSMCHVLMMRLAVAAGAIRLAPFPRLIALEGRQFNHLTAVAFNPSTTNGITSLCCAKYDVTIISLIQCFIFFNDISTWFPNAALVAHETSYSGLRWMTCCKRKLHSSACNTEKYHNHHYTRYFILL